MSTSSKAVDGGDRVVARLALLLSFLPQEVIVAVDGQEHWDSGNGELSIFGNKKGGVHINPELSVAQVDQNKPGRTTTHKIASFSGGEREEWIKDAIKAGWTLRTNCAVTMLRNPRALK